MTFNKRNIKLFVISGKARSGKEEVTNIIKEYYKDKSVIDLSFGYYIKDYAKRISDWDGSEETKPRELLQQLGIELIKNKIDNRLFIDRILQDIKVFSYFYDIIIVNDVRLIDELKVLKEEYPSLISFRINRDNYNDGLTNEEKKHITEVELDNCLDFDYIIKNDSLEQLNKDVINILKEV